MNADIYDFRSLKDFRAQKPQGNSSSKEIWSLEDLVAHTRMSKGTVYSIVNRPGFPAPLGNPFRNRRWLAKDVKAYFEQISKNSYRSQVPVSVDRNLEPVSIEFSKKEYR